jgi:hypothetical protein
MKLRQVPFYNRVEDWTMNANIFLPINLAPAFYNVGTIWAHEIDIFRTWRIVDRVRFHEVQRAHFRRLPFWIFTPVALAILGAVAGSAGKG